MLFGQTSPAVNYNINHSIEVPQGPTDGITCLAWFPANQGNQTLLAASSWDKSVRVWDVRIDSMSSNIQFQAKAMYTHEAPILSCVFSRQNILFSGGCDNVVKMHNLASNQSQDIGKHDAPVSAVAFDDEKNICISASWDKTIRFWDCRQPNPVHTINIGYKIYSMDFKSPVIAVAASDRFVYALSMDNLQATPMKTETPLKMQLRSVKIFPDRKGFVAASIEGRCCIVHLDPAMKSNGFAFKCHRIEDRGVPPKCLVYPVNSLDFHPIITTAVATAGSDGTITFWEISKKQRLKGFENTKCPINQAVFDASGQMMAYSLSYDWHKGYAYSDPSKTPNKILVHIVKEDMLRLKEVAKR